MTEKRVIDQVALMGDAAERSSREGHCCAEAILLAAIEVYAPDTSREVTQMATGLCGGMGNHNATCGVFTGGALAIGLLTDGTSDSRRKRQVKTLSSRFQVELEQLAGGHICESLLKEMGIRNWNGRLCRELTRQGAEVLAGLMSESAGQ